MARFSDSKNGMCGWDSKTALGKSAEEMALSLGKGRSAFAEAEEVGT